VLFRSYFAKVKGCPSEKDKQQVANMLAKAAKWLGCEYRFIILPDGSIEAPLTRSELIDMIQKLK